MLKLPVGPVVLVFCLAGAILARADDRKSPVTGHDAIEKLNAEDQKQGTFFVFEDVDSSKNNGVWTNWMGPANPGDAIKLALDDMSAPAFGKSCVRMGVKFVPPNWAGVAVASRPDYWGETADATAFNLSKATKLVVHVRGEKGGEVIQLKAAIAGDKHFGDSAKIPVVSPWLKLSKDWQRIEIPIDQKRSDLSRVITPFVIVTDWSHNSSSDLVVYLDQIYYVIGK